MKDRLITLFGGLFALYLVITLLIPPSQPDYASYPLTIDRDQHGMALLYEWLGKNNILLHSSRQRYDDILSQAKIPDDGNLMVISLPLKMQARKAEIASLRQWIAQGNTVVILAAHSDSPAWVASKQNSRSNSNFPLLSSLGFNISVDVKSETSDEDKDEEKIQSLYNAIKATEPSEASIVATGINNPAIKSVIVKQRQSKQEKWILSPRESKRGSRVLLAESKNKDSAALWQISIGSGNLIVSRYADLFSNRWLTKGDNARLFDTLLQQHLAEDSYVLFDDMHQGLTELYDSDAFYSDSRLHNTLWFLLGFWLLYLIGHSNRLAPPLSETRKHHAADFIRAIGGLFARRLSNATTALGLIRAFFNEVRQQYGLPMNSEPVWQLLDDAPRIDKQQLVSLQTAYNTAQQDKKQNLIKLHNQLRNTRKSLL